MPLVFTYGTLEIPEVMQAVTGQVFASREATAKDFVRYLIQDCVYPGMVSAKGETTSGRLYGPVEYCTPMAHKSSRYARHRQGEGMFKKVRPVLS